MSSTFLAYSLSGFSLGLLVGLTGVGGGSLMTPILILVFGVNPATAVGTDLLYAAVTKAGGTVVHGLHQTVDWRIVRRLALGSVPASALTLLTLVYLDINSEGSRELITAILSAALIFTAAALIFRRGIVAFYAAHVGELDEQKTAQLTIAMGAVLGVLVSISSIGAGAIGVTGLILLYPRLPTARIVGSDICHAVPLAVVAGIGHWILGTIDWPLLGSLLFGSLPGIALGSYLATRLPDTVLRLTLAAMLFLVGSRLVL